MEEFIFIFKKRKFSRLKNNLKRKHDQDRTSKYNRKRKKKL